MSGGKRPCEMVRNACYLAKECNRLWTHLATQDVHNEIPLFLAIKVYLLGKGQYFHFKCYLLGLEPRFVCSPLGVFLTSIPDLLLWGISHWGIMTTGMILNTVKCEDFSMLLLA